MAFQKSIQDFKSILQGGGVRPTMFQVEMVFPSTVVADANQQTNEGTFLIKAAQLPKAQVNNIQVPFRGRNLKVAGDRTFDVWTVTIINDTDFGIRNAIERWMNGINDLAENTGVIAAADYQADLTVEQLDRDDTTLKTYIFRNAYPLTLAQIDLSYETTNAIEEFEVTWRYQHFEASGVNF